MLRSPVESLARHRGTTAGVVIAMAASLWLVAALGSAIIQIQNGADAWWDEFYPVVYLDSGTTEAEVDQVRDEIDSLSQVSAVTVESAEAMVDRLAEEFGADEVRAMGVEASMMPTALVVQPSIWRPGEPELVARLEAMKVRQSVMDVDAPEPGALSWLKRGRTVVGGVAAAVVAVFGASVIGLASFLRHLQYRHRRENHLLEVFGATPMALRRATLFRGLVLGTAAGVVAAIGFLPWALAADGVVAEVAGTGAMSAATSAIVSVVILTTGAVVGIVAGWGCARPFEERGDERMESLLEWEDEAT